MIYKDKGCNHMWSCPCNFHWCWQCGGPYYGSEEVTHDGKVRPRPTLHIKHNNKYSSFFSDLYAIPYYLVLYM